MLANLIKANGYFNVFGNAARKDEHDYVVSIKSSSKRNLSDVSNRFILVITFTKAAQRESVHTTRQGIPLVFGTTEPATDRYCPRNLVRGCNSLT